MKINYTQELEENVIKDYLDGKMTKKEIRKKYNLWSSQFCYIIKKNNIPLINRRAIDSPTKKYNYDTNYFKEINTEEKAYFLGLLMADGWVSQGKSNWTLGLAMTDKDCIEKFQTALKTNSPIKLREANIKDGVSRKACYFLYITCKEIIEDLNKLGIIGNKTNRTYIPNIPKELIRHFIRGYFDGDGCIYVRKNTKNSNCSCSITSSSQLIIKQIYNILLNNNIKSFIRQHKPTYSTVNIDNRLESLKFLDYIYKDCSIYMNRKYNKYLEIKNKPIRIKNTSSSSKYFGVSKITQSRIKKDKLKKTFTAFIQKNGKSSFIGNFKNEKEAAIAYNNKAIELGFPEWKLNKIED